MVEWARRVGVLPTTTEVSDDRGEELAEQARSRAVSGLDPGRLRTSMAWAQDYVAYTGRPFFKPLRDAADLDNSSYNKRSLEGMAEYIRDRGSRAKGREGQTLRGDSIQAAVGTLRVLAEEVGGRIVVLPDPEKSRLYKSMRLEDGPPGSRVSSRALRALHLRKLVELKYDRTSPVGRDEWDAALTAHNLLLRGGEAGRVENKDFDPARGLNWQALEWRAPSQSTGGRAWLVAWICAIKDQSGTNKREPIVVAERNVGRAAPGEEGMVDPLCTYSALRARWQRVVGDLPRDVRGAVHGRLDGKHPMARKPVFTNARGVAYDTRDMRSIAQRMAAACGEDAATFGAKSFRSGGATDIRGSMGTQGMHMIKQRGRWNSDIAEIYQRALVGDQIAGSVAMGDAAGADLESLLLGWSQPA